MTARPSDELAQMILSVIALIPQGKVASYGQVARLAGLPRHARLVGRVLRDMDESSDLPWYRVINSHGKISVHRLDEHGMNIQTAKLIQEGIAVIGDKVNLKLYQWDGITQ
ncbi:methyltransferase [Acinetobacter sp. LoGeW2-3]|uniref:MGMT family protein n=1 Tax=Acinetobacter sp. LoGeW2-3 TaxID=1808001 RepID=UPI000C05C771|nr:MGMT family protein [Acinetobacter sp. LoGeW2-3]ATO18316.1 methyltransferase [Acinetobacter sp. LoGeW2-3]